jgi:glyoxylase-like metal-dependent hydrolase (beta-lactamase superfamily II)
MLRKTLLAILIVIVLAVGGLGYALHAAHRQMDALAPTLPSVTEVLAPTDESDLPVRVTWFNTATQPMPRSAVLEPSLDPAPDERYVMSHASFMFEWSDGRRLVFDVGMTPDEAASFGRPMELLAHAAPMQPIASLAHQLGAGAEAVRAVAFSHLHEDHVGGLPALCDAVGHPVTVFQQALQAEQSNYTTAKGVEILDSASCVERKRVGEDGRLEGFPGLRLITIAGHTPGSQMLVAKVRDGDRAETWIFTGDAVNHVAGIEHNLPKPYVYSHYLIPENAEQLDRVRRWLASAAGRGAHLAVSHDQHQLESSGLFLQPPSGTAS